MRGLIQIVGRISGVVATSESGSPVGARKLRLTATALVVALLAWAGLPESVAVPLGEFLAELVAQ